ncbi:CABYR protein, partial [Chloroceryle aenea]|nr:CABYR protein [Chloroceryle aenea]
AEMQPSNIRMPVPYGLTALLEGVSRAAIESNPADVAEFFALYFQDLVAFQKGFCSGLALMDVYLAESRYEGLEKNSSESTNTLFSGEPKQKDKCTNTEDDLFLEEPDIQYSSKGTQHPSTASSVAESRSPPASDEAPSPEGAELVYVPAEPAQLADYVLDNRGSLCSGRDEATSVQTLDEDSQTSENELTPVEGAAEDASAIPAAEAYLEAVGSQT